MHQPFNLSNVKRSLNVNTLTRNNFGQNNFGQSYKLLSLLVLALLASCSSTGGPAEVESRPVVSNQDNPPTQQADPQDTSQGLGRREKLNDYEINIERAEYYDQIASDKTDQTSTTETEGTTRTNASLSAAENFIQAGDYPRAAQSISALEPSQLNQENHDRYNIVQAYVAYEQGNFNASLQLLDDLLNRPVESSSQLTTQQVDALLLSSFCYQSIGDYNSAISALARREGALSGNARAETTRYTWQVINSLSIEQKQALIQDTNNTMVRNRVEQSLNGQIGQTRVAPSQFTQWRNEAPAVATQTIDGQWTNASPRNIAVLLPLNSKFAQAAKAVRDGIEYQHSNNNSIYRPNLRFYDIGNDAIQAPLYYQTAINNGADMVIGPLGKDYANQIVRFSSGAPTLLLGGDSSLRANFSRFTLSPEMEGVRVAERAFNQGHVTAAVLRPDTRSAQRSSAAFNRRWLELGGKLSQETLYSAAQFDHSAELRQLFAFGRSEYRHSKLSTTLGFKPKFTAYQRADIDFIFLIADNNSGRIVRPQINFFSGSKVPVYATSDIFNGIQNIADNMDLDQTLFPVMPWVLRSKDVAPYAGKLNKLYALGSDAYLFAGNSNKLLNNPNHSINGNTGQLVRRASGEISNQPLWATFTKGEAVAVENLGYDLSPMIAPIDSATRSENSSNNTQYNDNNWDSRQSRRKVSP